MLCLFKQDNTDQYDQQEQHEIGNHRGNHRRLVSIPFGSSLGLGVLVLSCRVHCQVFVFLQLQYNLEEIRHNLFDLF